MLNNTVIEIRIQVSLCQAMLFILLATVTLMLSSGAVSASSTITNWSYFVQDDPKIWRLLEKEYHLCDSGINQSSTNINGSYLSNLFTLGFNYSGVPLQIVNNSHAIKINYNTTVDHEKFTIEIANKRYHLPSVISYGRSIIISGEKYRLLQVYFNNPNEHYLASKPYAMEAHFVHANSVGQLAVVDGFFKSDKNNKFIDSLWHQMPRNTDGIHVNNSIHLNAENLLPENKNYYHYRDSLTTSACSEGVRWFDMRNFVKVSSSQIVKFLSVINENAHPV